MEVSMKIYDNLDRFLNDHNFKVTYFNNKINVNNYEEIVDFSPKQIDIKYKDGLFTITGNNLVITKMFDNEILITGIIETLKNIQT